MLTSRDLILMEIRRGSLRFPDHRITPGEIDGIPHYECVCGAILGPTQSLANENLVRHLADLAES